MSKKRKILYTLLIAIVILIFNVSKTYAFPNNMYDFSKTPYTELMSKAFLDIAVKKIGEKFEIGDYRPGFQTKEAPSQGWCLNENSGNIFGIAENKRSLLAILDIAVTSAEKATTAVGYSYGSSTPKTASDAEFATIAYLEYLASYYYKGANDFVDAEYNNYLGKTWVQHAWWYGYKKTFAPAIRKIMTGKAYNAFESAGSYSARTEEQVDLVIYNTAKKYSEFCNSIVNNKGKAISKTSDITEIEEVRKNENGIVLGPVKLGSLIKDTSKKVTRTSKNGGTYSGYTWISKDGTKTLKLGEGTKNRITVRIIFKDGSSKYITYDVVGNKYYKDEDIQIVTDLNGSNAQGIWNMPVNKEFYIYIKNPNIGYGDIEKVEIIDSYQLYSGRLYMFDCTGSGGQDQGVPAGAQAGNGKVIQDKVEYKVNNNFDLSLRKAITKVTKVDGTVDDRSKEERGLTVKNITPLKNYESTTAIYAEKSEKIIEAEVGDKIAYTIRVYNEGVIDGYATQITEYIPEGLKYVENSTINQTYKWEYTGNTTTINGITYKIYTTNYLNDKLIKAYDQGDVLSYQTVQIECEVDTIGGGILYNIAAITGLKDVTGNTYDRDSQTEKISGDYEFVRQNSTYQEDDDDYESVFKLINIGGKVFLDGSLTKEQEKEKNGKYDAGESPVEGIAVELYDSNDTLIRGPIKTDKNGQYKFTRVASDKSYYVKFYYNGVEYKATTCTHGQVDETIDSDAQESTADRTNLNSKFSEISYEFLQTDASKQRTIAASTLAYDGGTSTHIFENLNLGIYERTKADLSLFDDVLETRVEVNGKVQTYKYNEMDDANVNLREQDLEYSQNIYNSDIEKGRDSFKFFITYRIKVENESSVMSTAKEIVNYYDPRYTPVGITAKTEKGENIKVESDVTTKYFGLTNNAKISNPNIDDKYYTENGYKALYIQLTDDKYIGNSEEIWIDVTYELTNAAETLAKELENADLTKARNYSEIKGFKTTEGVMEEDSTPGNYMINPDKIEEQRKTKEDDYNKAPVFMYKYVDPRTLEGNVWEAIDSEVKQGADLYNNDKLLSYIKDNGIKGIKVELVELCEDGTQRLDQETETDGIGAYKFEGFIPGNYVVRFIYGTNKNAVGKTTYNYNEKQYNAIVNGQNYQSTKANPNINNNKYWYDDSKETQYSDAYDDAKYRTDQINSLTEFSYEDARKLLDQDYENYQNTEMVAYTGKLELEVEYATEITQYDPNKKVEYKVINVDFGLTPRTETDIELNKEISHIKLTLNDGTVQIDATVEDGKLKGDKTRGMKFIKGVLADIELEDELIQGATLEITYNISAKNNTKKEVLKLFKGEDGNIAAVSYYGENIDKLPAYEGKDRDETDQVLTYEGTNSYRIVSKKSEDSVEPKTEILQLIDYSATLSTDVNAQSDTWKKISDNTITKIRDRDAEGNEQEIDVSGYTTCIESVKDKVVLGYGDQVSYGITSSTVLQQGTITDLEFNYKNNAAVTKLSTNTGRIKDLTKLNATSEETAITDPTGQQVIYYIISGAAIIIFGVGTVLIKKFVLKKKEE